MCKPGRCIAQVFAGLMACVSLLVFDSSAQSFPVKPIRIVVGFTAGGGSDLTARLVGQKVSEYLGQPVVVENRTGAGGSIAAERVATAPADGYTLLMISVTDIVQPMLRKVPYDVERDFAPLSLVATGAQVLVVHPSVPARNVKELIALARSQPGKLTYGSAGIGGVGHLAGELFNMMAKVSTVHVPYKGGSEVVIAIAGGQIAMSFATLTSAQGLIKTGALRPLAVTTLKRAPLMPSIPTIDESGLAGYDYSVWRGMLAPAGVPKDVITLLNAVIGKAVNTAEFKETFSNEGLESQSPAPEQFAKFLRNETVQHRKLIQAAGIKAE